MFLCLPLLPRIQEQDGKATNLFHSRFKTYTKLPRKLITSVFSPKHGVSTELAKYCHFSYQFVYQRLLGGVAGPDGAVMSTTEVARLGNTSEKLINYCSGENVQDGLFIFFLAFLFCFCFYFTLLEIKSRALYGGGKGFTTEQ